MASTCARLSSVLAPNVTELSFDEGTAATATAAVVVIPLTGVVALKQQWLVVVWSMWFALHLIGSVSSESIDDDDDDDEV